MDLSVKRMLEKGMVDVVKPSNQGIRKLME